jgi:hypothetical protein
VYNFFLLRKDKNNAIKVKGVSIMEKDRITAIKSSSSGEIEAYELSSGKIITKEEAIGLARNGKIDGVQVLESKKGEEYLRADQMMMKATI